MADQQVVQAWDEHGNPVAPTRGNPVRATPQVVQAWDERGNPVQATSQIQATPQTHMGGAGGTWEEPLSPVEHAAVSARPGEPLSLGGKGVLGKGQASIWGLQDYLRQKQLTEAAQTGKQPGFGSKLTDWALGSGADLVGLVGAPSASLKNAALTAAMMTPIARVPALTYFGYQSAQGMFQEKQPEETHADYIERRILGAAGMAGAATGLRKPVANTADFWNRAKNLESVNKASTGLLQGKLAPLAAKVDVLMERRIGVRAAALERADANLKSSLGKSADASTITPVNLVKALADHPDPVFQSPASGRAYVEIQGLQNGTDFATARAARTRLGMAAAAAERSAKTAGDARILWALYDGIRSDMEAHADGPLKMPNQFKAYNADAQARFDFQRGRLGHLLDTEAYSREHPAIRLFTAGETPGIALINELGDPNKVPSGEIRVLRQHMQELQMNPAELDNALKDARALASAHNSFTGKGQMGGIWRMATAGGSTALLALGLYGAAHGLGIYGFMPYLLAMGATAGKTRLASRIEGGRSIQALGKELPTEAFRTGRALSTEELPVSPAPVSADNVVRAAGLPTGEAPSSRPATPEERASMQEAQDMREQHVAELKKALRSRRQETIKATTKPPPGSSAEQDAGIKSKQSGRKTVQDRNVPTESLTPISADKIAEGGLVRLSTGEIGHVVVKRGKLTRVRLSAPQAGKE